MANYPDVWGTVTTTGYNLLGQATTSTVTPPGGVGIVTVLTYNVDGQVETVTVDNVLMADRVRRVRAADQGVCGRY
ncbi:hypothetical protein [Agromyces sp. PvR057]|uniref:hypothetical protein n=1 Tax=Agromyces sp. PvR057 TaxID=3156403 RepID=UPI000E2408F0